MFPLSEEENKINPLKVVLDVVKQSRDVEHLDDCMNNVNMLDKVSVMLDRQMETMSRGFKNADENGSVFRWVLERIEEHLYQQNLTLDWSLFGQLDQQRKLQSLQNSVEKYQTQLTNVYQTKSFA